MQVISGGGLWIKTNTAIEQILSVFTGDARDVALRDALGGLILPELEPQS